MKFSGPGIILLISLWACTPGLSQQHKKDSIPEPLGFVNDFENIFSAKQERYLDSMIGSFEKRTTIQIALITVDTSMVSRADFDDYIVKLANRWGVGQKEKRNGIAVGISKIYRHMRIANGYGIEKIMFYAQTKTIIDTAFLPYFKKGEYFQGTVSGLKAIMKKLE
jgi:uncharacterized protein